MRRRPSWRGSARRCGDERRKVDCGPTEMKKLELVREAKLFRLIPGRTRKSRLEASGIARSEEHTSELQSQSNLVCRLLLEKKKKKNNNTHRDKMHHTKNI